MKRLAIKKTTILLLVWMMIFSTCVNSVWAEDEPLIEEPTAEETLDTSVEMSQEEPEASLEEVALETEEAQEEAVQEVEEAQPIEEAVAQEETEEPQEEVEISIEETTTIENVKEGSEYYFSDYSPLVITLTKDNPSVTVQYSSNAATQKGASTTPEVYCFIRQDSVLENWKNFRYKVASWGGTSTSQVTYSAPDGYNVQWTMAYGNRYTQYNDTFTFFLTDDADDAAEVHLMIGLRPKSAWSVTAVKNIIFTKRDGSTLTHYDTTYFFRQYDEEPEERYYEEDGQYYLFNGWINQYGFISNTICYEDNLIYQPMYEKGNAIFFKDGDTILNADNPEVVYENQTIRTTDDFVMKYFPENKDGYIFEGYFNEKDGSALGSQPITENTTFVASWKAIDESAEKITFHLMTDTSELQAGAHYIITTANMLSADADKQEYMFFSTLDGNNNAIDLKFDAALTELTISSDLDCIYTASGVTVNDSTQGSAKFTAVNGQKMKLGTSSSELTPLFNEKGGTIELLYNSSKGGWMIRNSNRYLMYDENIMGFRAAYHYYNCAPLIWPDAQPKEEEEEPVVNEALYVLDQEVYSYSTEHNKKGLLVVYTDEEGKSWAMTSTGAVEVEKSITTGTDGEKVTYIRTNKKNSWTSSDEWWTEGIDDYNCFSTISTLKSSDGKYFAVNDDGYVSDQPTGLTVVQNYSQCEINFTNWKISHLENAVLTVGYEALMIAWDAETKTFYPTQDIDKVIHVEFYRMSDDASTKKYYRLNTIEEIANADTIVIAMQSPQSSHPGARVILGKNGFAPNGLMYGNLDGSILNVVTYSGRNMMYELKTGEVLSKGESYVKFASLSLDSYNYYYPNKVTTNGTLFGSQAKDVRLVYDKETGNIYLRGNSDSTYLSFDKDLGRFVTVDKNSDQKIAIEVYGVTSVDKLYTVTYHDETGTAKDPIFVGKEFTPLASTDTVEKDGLNYTLVGWSTKSSVTTFLSLEDSCDLYDFTDATQTGSLKAAVKEKYSIIGNCNPDKADVVETAGLLKENNIDLYPVYAVRGFESVVSANDGDIPVLGVSDWKAIQDEESQYKNVEKEKWLGKINVEVYKDGEIWLESSPVYFSYHNDDAVDLNIKFIWDSLMNGGGDQALPTDEDPLYKYVSDTSLFPEYDQSGHYVIDAVYAMQGGSEDGLKYKLNWMTDHGGQLDNVQGGSTVKIYVSNKYNVKYYLDDELISDEDWVNEKTYTTCETEEKFQADSKDASYRVTSTNLTGLMERDIETVDDQKFFNVDVFTRTEYYGFSYQMHEYEHVIPLAKTPEELVSENRYLESVNWSLKNQNMEELETAEFSQDYAVTSKSKANAYMEETMSTSFEAENVKTFHLYAYTGDQHYFDMEISITKKVTENGKAAKDTATYWFGVFEVDENDNPITDNGPLYTAAIVLDNQAEGSTSVTVGTGKLGAAVKYFVAELEMDDEGNFTIIDPDAANNSISATVTYDTQLVVVDWTNQENGSVVCTNDYYKGEYKKTGVDMSMFPWVFSMGCSLLIMILLLFLKGCYVDFDKCRR